MGAIGYNTNLAAEFHVLSVLHRLGLDASLSLGNKKSVDITVVHGIGSAVTIDVKGLAGTTSWPVDNIGPPQPGHFVVFVCFRGKIADPAVLPEAWVVPSSRVADLTYHSPNGERHVVQRSTLNAKAQKYKDAWHQVVRLKRCQEPFCPNSRSLAGTRNGS